MTLWTSEPCLLLLQSLAFSFRSLQQGEAHSALNLKLQQSSRCKAKTGTQLLVKNITLLQLLSLLSENS